jgi:transposase
MESLLIDDRLFEMEGEALPASVSAPAGVDKTFRSYDPNQSFLLPPSLDDWLPEDHTARFVAEVVDDLLDLSAIYNAYESASGAPPYDPRLMLKLVLFGYSTGVTSSREMERRCVVDVAFRWLSANAAPDYRSISRFRRRHLDALGDLFVQVLSLCAQAGLVKLGRVALDGTKLRASANRHQAMSYDRIGPRIEQLQAEVAAILAEAEATDRHEDEVFGEDRRGDEVPPELARRETRLIKLRAAQEALEHEARDKATSQAAEKARARGADDTQATTAGEEAGARAIPEGRAQRNFTDPEARMMKTNDGFHYAYNAQAVVDEQSQVVLAAEVVQSASDVDQLLPMIDAAVQRLSDAGISGSPDVILADAGYCSAKNLTEIGEIGVDVLIATGRLKRDERVVSPKGRIPNNATRRELMARRLRTKAGRADYARRKVIVEPAFGQMKVRQRAGHLRLRGLEGAQGEWMLHVICHNLRKLGNARTVALAAG